MFVKFSGFNPKGSYLSLEKEKETFCVVFTYCLNRALETRKSHIAVVHRRQRNVQKKRAARAKLFYTVKPMVGFFFLPFVA